MKKEKENYVLEEEGIWFNELLVKIQTYEGLYYTINKHTKEEILERKSKYEETTTESYSYNEIIDSFVHEDLCHLMGIGREELSSINTTKDGLIYLAYEKKIINRKEIKESLIQFN